MIPSSCIAKRFLQRKGFCIHAVKTHGIQVVGDHFPLIRIHLLKKSMGKLQCAGFTSPGAAIDKQQFFHIIKQPFLYSVADNFA